MRIFVSTKKTQGDKPDDFCFVPDGEILVFPFKTNNQSKEIINCLVGIETKSSTTTFLVKESDISKKEYIQKIASFFIQSGATSSQKEANEWGIIYAEKIIFYAEKFPVGSVVGKKSQWTFYQRGKSNQL
jgi:hypothetical protein